GHADGGGQRPLPRARTRLRRHPADHRCPGGPRTCRRLARGPDLSLTAAGRSSSSLTESPMNMRLPLSLLLMAALAACSGQDTPAPQDNSAPATEAAPAAAPQDTDAAAPQEGDAGEPAAPAAPAPAA